ncbi:MAG: hypothetical protein ACSLFD_10740 [Solirubrobacterales bacterium]
MNDKTETLERERRWALAAGLLSVLGVVLIAVSYVLSASQVPTGDGAADFLANVQDNRGGLVLVNIIQALGYLCLIAPLLYLFKAATARSNQVKAGLIGLVIAAPLFLAGAAITNAVANLQAASDYKEKSAAPVEACINEENEENGSDARGATAPESARTNADGVTGSTGKTGDTASTGSDSTDDEETKSSEDIATDCADETAEDFQREASTRNLTVGLGLAGALGFTISIVYIALSTMRTGLISRFWGSLGMALGAVSILFPQFTLLWFIYVGFLITGFIPGGKPPAWTAGEAIPWPPPGTPPDDDGGEGEVIEGSATELDDEPDPDPDGPQIERKKRKRRN